MAPKFMTVINAVSSVGETMAHIKPGLMGVAPESGPGVLGIGKDGDGVEGLSDAGAGASGYSKTGPGLWAGSEAGEGLHAETNSPLLYAVAAYHKSHIAALGAHGGAIYAESNSGQAGYFKGNIHVTGQIDAGGDITCSNGGDCAEYFDVAEGCVADPGTVMTLDQEGALRESHTAYDKRVAGVVSGAGYYRPGILLDRRPAGDERKAIALLGKVFCKVDASYAPIEAGDLLTTSQTPGHAMKASDPYRAFGAVLGKALKPMSEGTGMIPILVTLQ